MIWPCWPPPRWTSSSAARPPPSLPLLPGARWPWRWGGEAHDDADTNAVRHLLPLGREPPEAEPPPDEARRRVAGHQLRGGAPRRRGAVDGPRRARRGQGRPRGPPLREPAGVGLRGPRDALRRG